MKTRISYAHTLSSLWLTAVLVLAGCADTSKTVAPPVEHPSVSTAPAVPTKAARTAGQEPAPEIIPRPAPLVHTVTWRGETLSIIAKWYTGKFANWTLLAKANPDLHPNRIHHGDHVVIPAEILKTRTPLPKNFLARLRSTSRKKAVSPRPKSRPAPEEPLPLFGPKAYSGTYGQP
ncbi:MAG: LysM peptidoglycan-binding domain-containing protein [Deltaproteobacteria bacterium]|nr:LysM peptidoglycan-binding domain-containing protein [Deltaproteobacteria bacterium]